MNIYSKTGALLLGLIFTAQAAAQATPEDTLDALYKAGAQGSQADFIALLTPDAVFLGIEGSERLQGQALRDFLSANVASVNSRGFQSSQRVIQQSADGTVAWFDETLGSDQSGHGRASGVLVQNGGVWKVAQYNLITPPPGGGATTSPASVPAAVAPAANETPQKPECRKIRHKTNKQASC
jgi:hypothetical protein